MNNFVFNEHTTGIIKYENIIYQPNFDLEKTEDITKKILNAKSIINDSKFINNYNYDNFNWSSVILSDLYWKYSFNFIKYYELINIVNKDYKKILINKNNHNSDFFMIADLIFNNDKFKFSYFVMTKLFIKKIFKNIPILYNIYLTIKECYKIKYFKKIFKKKKIIFDTLISNNFRTKEIENYLNKLKIDFYNSPGEFRKEIFIKNWSVKNKYNFQKKNFNKIENIFLSNTLNEIEKTIYLSQKKYKFYLQKLKKLNIKYFLSMDEANSHIFPILYACKKLKIKTIGYQHGNLYSRWHFAYNQNGLENFKYDWFDTVLVWSSYWKLKAQNCKNLSNTNFIIAKNYNFKKKVAVENFRKTFKENLNILVPYEFLGDTIEIGKYLKKLIENNHKIYFKTRPDENINDQLYAYQLSHDLIQKITLVEDIDNKMMNEIDCIFGSSTTFLHNCISYKKPILIAETKFKLSIDLVKENFVKLVKFDDIKSLSKIVHETQTHSIDVDFYNCTKNIDDLLIKLLK